jgi:spore germination protein YaaH
VLGAPPAVPPAGYNVVPAIVAPAPDVVDDILRNTDLRNRHATQIATAVHDGNYAGIDIDYHDVNPQLREQFTEFVRTLSGALHDDSRTLTLTLPMPSSDSGSIDERAYDWEALGGLADTVEIAPDLDQELYFQRAEAALQHITDRVDRAKLLLTVPSSSIERGTEGYRTLSFQEAMTLASLIGVGAEGAITTGASVPLRAQNLATAEGASGMSWDDVSRTVRFNYPGRGGERTVWIANRFSAAFRVELAQRFQLGGVVISDVSTGSADVLVPVRQLSDTGDLDLSLPNGDLFATTWTASAGTLSATSGESVTWSAPAEAGQPEITLIVSDGVARVGQRIKLDVVAPQ